MKQFTLKPHIFLAIIFAGVFADADNAANSFSAGSGTSFKEETEESEGSKVSVLHFTDAAGTPQVAQVGDGLAVTYAADGTTFIGWTLVPAASVTENWVEVPTAATA